jgi:hypothetical protein
MSIIRNIGNLHDDTTGALTGYINPVTGKEEALNATAVQALVSAYGGFTARATALIAPGDGKTLTTTVGANATLDASELERSCSNW